MSVCNVLLAKSALRFRLDDEGYMRGTRIKMQLTSCFVCACQTVYNITTNVQNFKFILLVFVMRLMYIYNMQLLLCETINRDQIIILKSIPVFGELFLFLL
jgi:hypothetical protein